MYNTGLMTEAYHPPLEPGDQSYRPLAPELEPIEAFFQEAGRALRRAGNWNGTDAFELKGETPEGSFRMHDYNVVHTRDYKREQPSGSAGTQAEHWRCLECGASVITVEGQVTQTKSVQYVLFRPSTINTGSGMVQLLYMEPELGIDFASDEPVILAREEDSTDPHAIPEPYRRVADPSADPRLARLQEAIAAA